MNSKNCQNDTKNKQSKAPGQLSSFIAKMEAEGLPPLVIETFSYYYYKVIRGETGLVCDHDITPLQPGEIEDFCNLTDYVDVGKDARRQAVWIVLNGGLGTSMGLTGTKSLLEVKAGKSFLEIIVRQAEKSAVQLGLMNSFNTHEETRAAIAGMQSKIRPLTFLQHKFPKILKKDLSPATWPQQPRLEWNPPGHGDVYTALFTSGMLPQLLKAGIIYAFISNCDNLGACLDESLLGYFAAHRFPFMMEVAEKTPTDRKGGHLARQKNGRLILREIAQCPQDEREAFDDIQRYRYFNTNNVWINLNALKDLFAEQKLISLPLILNPKTLDPRDATSPPVYQIESAMGAAISLFEDTAAVKVPRTRFYPVKTCNDLVAVRSDCFVYAADETVRINPKRDSKKTADVVKVKLDPRYYGKIDDLDQRFCAGVPSLVECDSLTVKGDVKFEGNVVVKGSVTIQNSRDTQVVIEAGAVIDQDLHF
jgi:UTP--glucose-1-phosphate uridylyltransferase